MDVIPWMLDMDIEFSKAIEVKESDIGGTGVFATRPIANGDILLKIPKSAVLSANTCGISNIISEHPEVELLNLAVVAYLFEKGQGKESPWFPFIEFVERAPVPDVPRLWRPQEQALLAGTNLSIWDGLDSDQLRENYETCLPLFEDYAGLLHVSPPSFDDFVRATLIVSSRAFDVDNYHELAIAPGACFFNHSDRETVHFESDGSVCPSCGSLSCGCIIESDDEWEEQSGDEEEEGSEGDDQSDDDDAADSHSDKAASGDEEDDEMGSNADSEAAGDDEDDNACVIKALTDIECGQEIFNTYGEDPNGVLLARYGFTIWGNQHEVVDLNPQVDQFAKKFKVSKTVNSWREKQELRIEEDEELEEDPLFLGFISTPEGPALSPGLTNLARKLKIDRRVMARELALLRLKSYALAESSSELHELARNASDARKKNIFTIVGTEKLLLETVLSTL